MRTLTQSLLDAQRSASRRPYLKVEVDDGLAGVARPRFTRLYTGSEPDFYHTVTVAPDGSLIRARVTPSPSQLYVQRVPNPGSGSDFSPWTLLNSVASTANIALYVSSTTVYLIYVATNGKSIYQRTSGDNGATWSAPTIIITPVENQTLWVAADINSAGKEALFYGVNTPMVKYMTRRGGSWSNSIAWPFFLSKIDGLVCAYQGDWNLLVTGQGSSNDYFVWTTIYGDGGAQAPDTWSSLRELDKAQQDSSIRFHHGSFFFADVCRASFVEEFTGTPASSRPTLTHLAPSAAFADNLWRDSVPFNLASTYGVALTYGGGALWFSTPAGVWQAVLNLPALDLSADTLEATVVEEGFRAQATVRLRNDDGRYDSPGAGSLAQLQQGAQLRLSPGYHTSAGVETSPGPLLWVTGWEHQVGQGQAQLVLHAIGPWEELGQWHARRQFSWDTGQASVATILKALLARMGLALDTTSASTVATSFSPAFTVHPGESGYAAVRRLLELVPDALRFQGATTVLFQTSATDPTDYAYGTDHVIPRASYATGTPTANRIQVFGDTGVGEGFLWQDLELRQPEMVQVHDLNLTTNQNLQDRVDAELRRRTIHTPAGELSVPANCGQELYDVVEVTDARAGLTAQQHRVVGLTLQFAADRRAVYLHQIALAARPRNA